MLVNAITEQVLKCAFKVHSELGPGLLESAYQQCLHYEISKSGYFSQMEYPIPLIYEEVKLDYGYRIDIFVEKQVIIEVKAVEVLNDIHLAQVLTYLKMANCQIGLLLNFNVLSLKHGIRRVINKHYKET